MSEQITLAQFIEKHGLKFECHRVDSRKDGLMDDKGQRHFRCRISKPYGEPMLRTTRDRSFGLYFSQGSAWTTDPTLADVLDCLASDASYYDDTIHADRGPFEQWALEMGYDTDSRSAEKIYRTVKRQAEQLRRMLGSEAYEELLYNVERQ